MKVENSLSQVRAPDTVWNGRSLVDSLLYALVTRGGAAAWFDPTENQDGERVHRVSIEKARARVSSRLLRDGFGDAMLARLALLSGIDLLDSGVRSGRVGVRVGEHTVDFLVTIRSVGGGLSGELRVLDELDDSPGLVQADGKAYPELLEAGTLVGPYRVKRELGSGGMGMVYEVEHETLRKHFAMKVLHKSALERDPDAARRFVREARAAARVQHEGIVQVSDFGGLSDGRQYLVMELLEGQSLFDISSREGAMEPVRALRLVRATAAALGAAHASGVVHRDVSPSNIFVDRVDGAEKIKVVDFGAASVPDADQKDVPDGPPGMMLGTPYYVAPEQVQALPTDMRSDMYSLGVVLYELISGHVPFDGTSAREIVLKHLNEHAPPLSSEGRQDIPAELCLIVERLLKKRPEDRYASTDALVADLDRMIAAMTRKGWRRWLAL